MKTKMNILDHLVRRRIFYILLVVLALTIFSFNSSDLIFRFLSEPYFLSFKDESLIGTGPMEAFILRIKVAIFFGVIISIPWIFLQIWFFIEPALYDKEKKLLIPFVFFTSILFLGGTFLCYQYVLPIAFEFFYQQYQAIGVVPTIRITEHLSLIIKILFAFGLIFEIPIISFFLAKLGLITSQDMLASWRYVVVGAFVIGAILTPPDIISQLLMAIPMIFLYLVSILIVKVVEKQ